MDAVHAYSKGTKAIRDGPQRTKLISRSSLSWYEPPGMQRQVGT